MNDTDVQRGKAIMAAHDLMAFLDDNVGHTKDWPVRFVVDDDAKATELAHLMTELRRNLKLLKP
jgi:hypothetical protein